MNKRLLSGHIAGAVFRIAACAIPTVMMGMAEAAEVVANFTSATTIPVTAASYTATKNTVNLTLNFAPPTGTNLTVVNNTGSNLIQGTFANLTQGQAVTLTYGGIGYPFVANYFGGTGNDLVLQWGNSRLMSWGNNRKGQLGKRDWADFSSVAVPVDVSGVLAGKAIMTTALGENHALALGFDGTVAAWGYNYYGELGNGDSGATDSNVPVLVNQSGVLAGKRVISLIASELFSLALCSDGTLAAWGRNYSGQLGDGSTTDSAVPVLVDRTGILANKSIIALAVGQYHTLALCSDGTLVGWGSNTYGQFGNGTNTDSSVPVAIQLTGVLAGKSLAGIAAGRAYSLVLCTDGTLAAWGSNSYGQLGNGSTAGKNVPVLVTKSGALVGKTVVAISAGNYHSLARCSDGALAAWGLNDYGQLGNNTTTNSRVPVLVDKTGVLAGRTPVAVFARSNHSLALCSDGNVVAWGLNTSGQLGDNSTANRSAPVLVNTSGLRVGERFVALAPGPAQNSLALSAAPPPPTATTLPTTAITPATATLKGTVNAAGGSVKVSFEYGPTPAYGSSGTAAPGTVTGTTTTVVSRPLTGLDPGATYHYRVVATSADGTTYGHDMTFTASNPPDFTGYTVSTPWRTSATIALRKILAKASDPDGDAISVTAAGPASANGGAVALLADAVRYTPPNGFSGTDTFTIVLTDEGGASTTGTVTVQVGSAPNAGTPAANANPPKLTTLPGGKMGIAFQGIPGRSYIVQRSAGGLDDWQTLATVTADATGGISYTDENPPPGSAFYRLGTP